MIKTIFCKTFNRKTANESQVPNNQNDEWALIYKEALTITKNEYQNSIEQIKRADEKVGRYLLIISITFLAFVSVTFHFYEFFIPNIGQTNLHWFVIFIIFTILTLFTHIIIVVKCSKVLKLVSTHRLPSILQTINEYNLDLYEKQKYVKKRSFDRFLMGKINDIIDKNLKISEEKHKPLKNIELIVNSVFCAISIEMILFCIVFYL